MTDSEIKDVVTQILRGHLAKYGFVDSEVASEVDFDGGSVIRVRARYGGEQVPTEKFSRSLSEIRSALISRGEDRFVILDSEYTDEDVDEDVE
jgi:hypothetical protein